MTELDAETGSAFWPEPYNQEFCAAGSTSPTPVRRRAGRPATGSPSWGATARWRGRQPWRQQTPAAQFGAGARSVTPRCRSRSAWARERSRRLVLLLGQGRIIACPRADARGTAASRLPTPPSKRCSGSGPERLETVQVRTPDDLLDPLVNRWLLYSGCTAGSGPERGWSISPEAHSASAISLTGCQALSLDEAPDLFRAHIVRAAAVIFLLRGRAMHLVANEARPAASPSSRTLLRDDSLLAACLHRRAITWSIDRDIGISRTSSCRSWEGSGPAVGETESYRTAQWSIRSHTRDGFFAHHLCSPSYRGITAGAHS